jgi:CRP/FNR family transcriptional regulator, cyclic AMP receptor protein
MKMIERFHGDSGRRLRVEALVTQKLVAGNKALAEELADIVELVAVKKGAELIEQDGSDNDIYFIFSGVMEVVVNHKVLQHRYTNDHVGEMAAITPSQKRSATIRAAEDAIVARITEPQFSEVSTRYTEMYRYIAQELSKRLMQRNALVKPARGEIKVFVICSVEALPIAKHIENAFAHDKKILIRVWSNGVFKVANYTLDDLEAEVDDSDFAVAIAHADDITAYRGTNWPAPRDNVVFELGLFMGRLGRRRAILMEPLYEEVKLPSDLAGVTTIAYRYEGENKDTAARMAPACNTLHSHIQSLGPNN